MQYAILVVGLGDVIGALAHQRLCVRHGNAKAGGLDHRNVVVTVAAADHLLGGKSDTGEELKKRMCLVDTRGHDLKEERI